MVIDGMPLDGQMTIGVLGIDLTGKKRLLGFREGATENSDVCKRLFEDLLRRGLRMGHATLVIIDGSKALRKAVDDFYGVNAVVLRRQFHSVPRKAQTRRMQCSFTDNTSESVSLGQMAAA